MFSGTAYSKYLAEGTKLRKIYDDFCLKVKELNLNIKEPEFKKLYIAFKLDNYSETNVFNFIIQAKRLILDVKLTEDTIESNKDKFIVENVKNLWGTGNARFYINDEKDFEFALQCVKWSYDTVINNKNIPYYESANEEIGEVTQDKINKEFIRKNKGKFNSIEEKDSFYTYLRNKGYFFDKETVENYLLSLKVKPFVILTGNSGTGKTKLSQLFAEYLSEKSNEEIVIDKEDEEYITVEVPIGQTVSKYLNEGKLFLNKRVMRRVLPIDKFEGNLEINFDGIKSSEKIFFLITGFCEDRSLKDYFKSISQESSVKIKINKKDIENTVKHDKLYDYNLNMNVNIGTSLLWGISRSEWHKILPINRNSSWNMIINGVPTEANIKLTDFFLDATKTNNKDLLDHFEKISNSNPREKIDILLNFGSFVSDFDQNNEISNEEKILLQESIESVKKSKDKELYKIIPVGANWTENRNIIGYHNLITGKYQSTPAYNLIKEAAEDDEPYFLILDEMNLSHVERYFADFLSAIESEKPIPLYGKKEELKIPNNLFIIGTVNVDETTYMFSPKVLDRANTIEFDTCAPQKYLFKEFDDSQFEGNVAYLENPLSDLNFDLRNVPMSELREEFKYVRVGFNKYFWPTLTEEINNFYEVLKGAGFDFGFRVIDEIVRFMYVAWKYEGEPTTFDNWQRYFDAQIKQKMLPKLHGSEKVLKKTLDELIDLCNKTVEVEIEDDDTNSVKTENKSYPVYIHSLVKLMEMKEVLKTQRYVSFIN